MCGCVGGGMCAACAERRDVCEYMYGRCVRRGGMCVDVCGEEGCVGTCAGIEKGCVWMCAGRRDVCG